MDHIFRLPDFGTEDQNIIARLNYFLAASLVPFSALFVVAIFILAPELLRRAAVIACVAIITSLTIMVLVRRRKLLASRIILITLIWTTVTIGSLTAGGVSAPIIMGYVIIIMLGGLELNRKTNFILTGICILSITLIAVAQSNNLLPEQIEYSHVARASVYIFFLLITVLLQSVNAMNIRGLLRHAQKSELRYRTLLENIPVTTYINSLDSEATTKYVSPQVEKLLGYSRNTFTDDPFFWTKILHPDDTVLVQEHSRQTAKTLESFNMEYRVIASNRRTVWLKDEARLVRDENGVPLFWLGIWTDITCIK